MSSLKTDSPISRRIVLAFLDFLNSVEPAPGVDIEGLEVVKECLEEVFKLNSSSVDDRTRPGLLVDMFSSADANKQHDTQMDLGHAAVSVDTPSTTTAQKTVNGNLSEASKSLNDEWTGDPHILGVSKDELFGKFCGALERIHFFKTTSSGDDDHEQLAKAKRLFDEALVEMEKSGCQTANLNNLAEALKSQGNHAMQSKLYSDALELYTCAISLCENNAVYYCNRAAAYTQVHKYSEAIADCNKSIEIDPNYSKAYSRLGLAYYAQGNYNDAIHKGFLKALQLDPNSTSIQENIRVAEQKLREELQWQERDQNAGPSHTQEPNNQSQGSSRNRGPPPFSSMPFNAGLPSDFANMIMNMAANAHPGQHTRDRPQNNNPDGPHEPEIRIDGNISLNFGEEVPEELSGTLRSVMEMLTSPNGPHGDMHRGSTPN
ncbi:uncharacterized protein LOC131237516 isoform X1 [Magnolia sinica]|uniref:uncharacterized protein LOC131237516 isoform X1 n=1 Tax=Magnolia sinica TaxID=86752 RepID=UPI00265B31E1|nr:uncharacterized protein LOC131237516 isoform X1 [Magnolia sinica]